MFNRFQLFVGLSEEIISSKEIYVQGLKIFLEKIKNEYPSELESFKTNINKCLNKEFGEEFKFIDKESPEMKLHYLQFLYRDDRKIFLDVKSTLSKFCFGNKDLFEFIKFYKI